MYTFVKLLLFLVFLYSCATPVVKPTAPPEAKPNNCPNTVIIKPEYYVFTRDDRINLESAKKRCVYHYPESPCLKVFKVLGERNYYATCGKPVNERTGNSND